MKKCIAILLCMATLFGGMFLLSACNDQIYGKIGDMCMTDGFQFQLPFYPQKANGFPFGDTFKTRRTLEEIKDAVDEMEIKNAEVSSEIYGRSLLIEVTEGGRVHYFMVQGGDGNYVVMFPSVEHMVLAPLHYFELPEEDLYHPQVNKQYKINATQQNFIDFYKKVYSTGLTEAGNKLIFLTGLEMPNGRGSTHYDLTVTVDFEQKTDGLYVTYDIEGYE